MSISSSGPSRRTFLATAAAALASVVAACARRSVDTTVARPPGTTSVLPTIADTVTTTSAPATTASSIAAAAGGRLNVADFVPLAVCELTPEQSEGPFYLPGDLLRRDITDGRPGLPLRVGLQVVDGDCLPIPGALVDIWHADAERDYSAFLDGSANDEEGEGTTFLRGSQMTDGDGITDFLTVYPGWYPGRTVHIHVKVHVGGRDLFTSQLYFPDDVTDEVLVTDAYAHRGPRTTTNPSDGIAGGENMLAIAQAATELGDGRLGLMVLGVPA